MKVLYLYIKSHPYLIAMGAITIIQITIILIYQFNGYFGQDSYEYLKTTRELIVFYKGGILPSYSVFPGMYPFICSLFGLLIPDLLFVLQFVSIISLMVSYILLREIILMIYKKDKYIDVYLFLFFALSPYILRFSIISMSDLTGIVLWLAALYLSLLFQQKGKVNFLIWASLFGGFAVMTRYPAIVILTMPALICIIQILKQKKYHLFGISFVFFLLGSLPDYLLKGRFFFWDINGSSPAFTYFYFLDQYSLSNFIKKDFYNLDGWQHYQFLNIIYVFQIFIHPAFIFIGTIFIIFIRKKHLVLKELQLAFLTVVIYIIFLAGNAYQSDRYLVFVLPLILVCYYAPFLDLINKFTWSPKKIFLFISLICALQLVLFIYSFRATTEMNRNERSIAESVSTLPGESTIYTFSIDGALKAYQPAVKIYDIYSNKLMDTAINNGYLLFNYGAFSKQFAGLFPMENYQFIKTCYALETVEKFDNGWELFQINSRTK